MKTSVLGSYAVVALLGVVLAACGPEREIALEPVKRVSLSPTPPPGEGGLHGLWLDGCRDVANTGGEIVGIVRDALLLRRDGGFEVHTTYFASGDCEKPEVSFVMQGEFSTGGVHLGGRAINFDVKETGYVAHAKKGIDFLREQCPGATAYDIGLLIPFEQCGGAFNEAFTYHSSFRRVSVPGAAEGMLLLGGLDFRPNFAGDASMKYPPAADALKHVSSRDDIIPALYEP